MRRLFYFCDMNEIILKAEKIRKSYSGDKKSETVVLTDVSMDVRKGEYLAIIGPSGVGKSTLLYILGTLEKPDAGTIHFSMNGDSIEPVKLDDRSLSHFRNRNIGFVFQFHHLLPEFSALENVMMPALIDGKPFSDSKKSATKLMDQVGVSHRLEHRPNELSGGEQQRCAIARALINHPEIVFADEPTGNLDSKNSESVLNLIADLQQEHDITFVVATHSKQVADQSERILTMGDGRIIKDEKNA